MQAEVQQHPGVERFQEGKCIFLPYYMSKAHGYSFLEEFYMDLTTKQAVSASISGTGYVFSLSPLKTNSNTMTQFYSINHKKLEDIIQHLKSSSYCRDILLLQKFFKLIFYKL